MDNVGYFRSFAEPAGVGFSRKLNGLKIFLSFHLELKPLIKSLSFTALPQCRECNLTPRLLIVET